MGAHLALRSLRPAMSWQCAITGQTYLYQVLPFGYKLSPYAFCRAMETFTRVLRSPDLPVTGRGTPEALLAAITSDLKQSRLSSAQAPLRMRILPYMDDYLALFPSQEEAVRGAVQMKTTLAFLGLEANPKKCVWTPTQELQHLGIVVNTKLAVFLVPQEKERKLVSFALGILRMMRQVPFGSCVPCADRNKMIIYPHMTETCGYSLVTVFLMKVR